MTITPITGAAGRRATRPRWRHAPLALLLCAAAPACKPQKPELLWSHDPKQYFSEADFEASFFSRSVVLVTKARDGVHYEKGVKALDPETGALRWEMSPAEWVLHPPGAAKPLFVVNRTPEPGATGEAARLGLAYREAVEIDPATGKEIRRVAFARPIDAFDARLMLAGGKLLFLTRGIGKHTLGAVDLSTGAILWEQACDAETLFPPLVLPDRVIFQGETYIAHAIDDGRELFRVKGVCCSAVASPDGRHAYVRVAVDQAAEVFPDGRLGAPLKGAVAAASDRFVAMRDSGLAVYPHGASAPSYVISAPDPDYTSAIALHGGALFFFRARDKTLWQRDLDAGKDRAIFEVGSKFVVSPDATGVSPAHLSAPPVFDPPLLFVEDWTIRAYRLP